VTITVGGHRYSDPDVLSLIYSGSDLLDPRAEVIRRARNLNQELRSFGTIDNPRERIEILASLAGITALPMANPPSPEQNREALLFRNSKGAAHAFYDSSRSDGRVNFSIAHEIVHTFFPNSMNGVRFRSVHSDESREATELERLCHLGASELLMPEEEFLGERGDEFGLKDVPRLAERFGSSYEATLYRLATTHPRLAVAGRLEYRLRVSEKRQIQDAKQKHLFASSEAPAESFQPKYRRQSLHSSLTCGANHLIPWNKSFDETSCVYRAGTMSEVVRGFESLPNRSGEPGLIECVQAPHQYSPSDPNFPDVLFLWCN
jgi:Zn-dependent peptidase ImmA (M78 family)